MESLLTKSMQITQARNAKTLTPSHMKQCILSESRFDFLKDLVKNIPDASVQEDNENNALFEEVSTKTEEDTGKMEEDEEEEAPVKQPAPRSKSKSSRRSVHEKEKHPPHTDVYPSPPPPNVAFSEQCPLPSSSSSTSRTPVIQYVPKVSAENKMSFSVNNLLKPDEPKLHITIASEELLPPIPQLIPTGRSSSGLPSRGHPSDNVPPPLIPIARFNQNSTENNLYIDEDYDN